MAIIMGNRTVEELSRRATGACIDIYNDYSWEEVIRQCSPAAQSAWKIGKTLVERQQFLDSKLTERIIGTAGDNVPAEIEFLNKNGEVVGFWAYGAYHPDYPFQG